MFWAGVIVSALPALMLSISAVMKLIRADVVLEQLNEFGWSENIVFAVGFVELACVVVYVVPQTAILGAILLTGYLGGAVAVHVRVSAIHSLPRLSSAHLSARALPARCPRPRPDTSATLT